MRRCRPRFNRDERASLAHAIMHLDANRIADPTNTCGGGWYCGNKAQFIKRHVKTIEFIRSLLKTGVGQ